MRTPLLLALLLAACAGQPAHPPPAPPALAAQQARTIDAIAQEMLEKGPAVGLSLAIAQHGRVLYARGYGLADRERNTRASERTIYRIGSITKQFTAVAILRLAGEGKLQLDDAVSKYVPEYPAEPPISLRRLLTHTSGIPDYVDASLLAHPEQTFSVPELIGTFSRRPLEFGPGTRFHYSNSGYILLGAVIERVSSLPYELAVAEHPLGDLALADTGYCPDQPRTAREAGLYTVRDGEIAAADPISMSWPRAAGALCSSALDLVLWTHALHSGLLSASAHRELTSPVALLDGSTAPYGFGLDLDELEGHRVFAHDGGIQGATGRVAYYPAEELAIALMVNTDRRGVDPAEERIARAVLGLAQPSVRSVPLSEQESKAFVGIYELPAEPIGALDIRYERGNLVARGASQTQRLLYQGESAFVGDGRPDVRLTFTSAAPGRPAAEVVLQVGQETFRGPRRP